MSSTWRCGHLIISIGLIAWTVAIFQSHVSAQPRDSSKGTLKVEVRSKWPAGSRNYGRKFVGEGETVWVYAAREGSPSLRRELVGVIKVGRIPSELLGPVLQELPVGDYSVDLVTATGDDFGPLTPLACPHKVSIRAGATTTVRFPLCDWESLGDKNYYVHAMSKDDLYWDDLDGSVSYSLDRCAEMDEPLANAYKAMIGSRPTKPVVFIEGPWIRLPPLEERHIYTVRLESREFDATQIKLLVKSLKYHCLSGREMKYWRKPTSPEEHRLAERLAANVGFRMRTLDALNRLAAILERAEREQNGR